MAKYQEYAEYKDSSIEWLGDVPTDWKCLPIKYLCYVNDGNHGEEYPKESDYTIEELGVPFIRGGNILNFEVTDKDMLYITKEKNTSMRKGRLQVDDILFVNRGDIGKLALISEKHKGANLNSQIAYLRCEDKSINNKFLLYFLASVYVSNLLNSIKMGSVLTQFPIGNILEIKVPLPNSVEQIKISNFLDYETSKIDDLIAKQEKLIELLKEKRQAVISHAVTKGLNPDVPMKDSGVEWLGQVPEHWEVKPLRYIGTCQNGINIGAEYFGSGSPFISYGDVYRNATLPESFDGLVRSSKNDKETYSLIRGDVLFTRTSETIEEIGFSSVCLKNIKDATFAGFLIRFRPLKNILYAEFSKFYFRNLLLRAFFVKEMNLVTRASLSQELLRKLPVPIASIEEQEEISIFLNQKEELFNKLISNSENQTRLLKERRTALISAAVTGKIDVRNWQNPNKNNEENMELST